MPGDPESASPLAEATTGARNEPRAGRPRRHPLVGALLLIGLLTAAGVGIYAFVYDLQSSSKTTAMDNFCNSVTLATQLAYDHKGNLETFHKLVDREARAVGGHVLSDTAGFELAVSHRDAASAQKYLGDLDSLCGSNGSPISTPVTT